MAGINFSPGEVGTKMLSVPRGYRYISKTNSPGDSTVPNYGPMLIADQVYIRKVRPGFPKGAFITLPGGELFRKSTAYEVQSWSIPDSTLGTYRGSYFEKYNFGWIFRGAEDAGREIGYLVTTEPAVFGLSIPQDARNEAVTKALTQIADQKVNLGENLATLGQTVRLFTDKAHLLTEALKYARKQKSWAKLLKKSKADLDRAGPLNVVAKEYLAYVYGLKPLVGDVWTLADLMKTQAKKTLLLKGVGRATRMQSFTGQNIGLSYSRLTRLGGNSERKVKCTIWARIDPDGTTLRSMNQLGLLNPFGLAWDLVPYSFVVDWFIPVGPVLYAMSAPAGLLFVDGSVAMRNTEISEYDYKAHTTSFDPAYNTKGSGQNMVVQRTYDGYVRQPLGSWPIPGLWVDQDPFRADRPLKALALSILALSGSRPPIR